MDEELARTAMQIIIHAGDARLLVHKAIGAMAEEDYQQATDQLEAANQELIKAHQVHTRMIQGEAEGEPLQYSMLFTHAQDTLMTISSELKLTKALHKVFQSLHLRLEKLEENQN